MKNNNKKKWVASAAALAAVAAMVGTFAWFTSQDNAVNKFEGAIAGNDIEIIEEFTPPEKWEPGQKVNKDVAIKNSGDHNALIRVSLKETIQKLASHEAKFASDGSVAGENSYLFPLGDKDYTGYVDGNIVNAPTITIANNKEEKGKYNGTYTLKVKELATGNATDGFKYSYVSFWEHNTTPDVKLYAKTGGYQRATDGKLTPLKTPEFQYVDLTYAAANTVNWTGEGNVAPNPTTPYIPTPAITGTGNAALIIDGAADSKIKIEFVNLSKDPMQDKWVYNEKDGNFYYVGVVKPEEQTAQLIDSVTLSDEAGNEYSKVKYDLEVNAKGIQAIDKAIDSTEWLNNTNAAITAELLKSDGLMISK